LLERAINECGNVKFRTSTVGETTKSELYGIRHLAIDRFTPDIEGEDHDAVKFKLSDYRGKVALL
jgi:hypothetical protein